MMEGYFVRNLGMHRVYNSAFMHMLRDENNAGYRGVIKEILATQPAILERFVNFMNNPDEETAADQFGTGDKYFGIATLLSTLPGLPMFGHGQLEGFREKYGMEFARAYHDESTDEGLLGYHEHVVFPLLRHRRRFGGVEFFRLYDFVTEHGEVNENVFAYSNKETVDGPPTLVIYNNSMDSTSGWLRCSVPVADGAEGTFVESLADALSIEEQTLYHWQDSGRGVSREESGASLQRHGLAVHLRGYETLVFDRIEPALEVPLDGGETEVIAPLGTVQVAADGDGSSPRQRSGFDDILRLFFMVTSISRRGSTRGRRPGMSSRAPRRFVTGTRASPPSVMRRTPRRACSMTAARLGGWTNNYAWMSFDVGPTLVKWLRRNEPTLLSAMIAADQESVDRCGFGGAIAQAYHHPIIPLCDAADRRRELRWGGSRASSRPLGVPPRVCGSRRPQWMKPRSRSAPPRASSL